MNVSELWRLADELEDKAKDRDKYGPMQRMCWREAFEDLAAILGERTVV